MKKILRTGVMLIIMAALITAGVYAAATAGNTLNNTESTVQFTATDVFATVVGTVDNVGTGGTASYDESTYTNLTTNAALPTWKMGAIELTKTTNSVTVTFTITNNGSKTVTVTVTPPTAPTGTSLAGGLKTPAEGKFDGGNVSSALALDGVAEFSYTLTLTDYSKSISATAFNFKVELE